MERSPKRIKNDSNYENVLKVVLLFGYAETHEWFELVRLKQISRGILSYINSKLLDESCSVLNMTFKNFEPVSICYNVPFPRPVLFKYSKELLIRNLLVHDYTDVDTIFYTVVVGNCVMLKLGITRKNNQFSIMEYMNDTYSIKASVRVNPENKQFTICASQRNKCM